MGLDDELRKAYKVKKGARKVFTVSKNYAKQSKSHVYGTRYEKGFHSAYMLVRQHAVFF